MAVPDGPLDNRASIQDWLIAATEESDCVQSGGDCNITKQACQLQALACAVGRGHSTKCGAGLSRFVSHAAGDAAGAYICHLWRQACLLQPL